MKLVIAEKPSVAKAICPVLGAITKKNGYMEGNGHMRTLKRNKKIEKVQEAFYV